MPSNSCVFCRRIHNNEFTECSPYTVRFEPLNPVTPGHMLFVPRGHVMDAADDPWVTAEVFKSASHYAQAIPQDFNLITSSGRSATQSVFHLHVHYVPRRVEDGLKLPWTDQVIS